MDLEGNTRKYFEIVMDEMTTAMNLKEMDEEHRKEVGEAILNTALDRDGPRSASRRFNDKLLFISNKLFKPFSEIFSNLEALENIGIYVRSFPYKRQGISQVDYLKYHVENYLNEIYILKNRLIAFLTLIERAYRKCERSDQIHAILRPIYELVSTALDGYINVRGAHVHENRYSDSDFDRLGTLNLLSKSGDDEVSRLFKGLFSECYRTTRRKWVGKIRRDIRAIEQLLEIYCTALVDSVIKDGKVVFPSNVRWI